MDINSIFFQIVEESDTGYNSAAVISPRNLYNKKSNLVLNGGGT